MGRGLKELAEENIVYKSEISGKLYSFNAAEKLNTLLLRMIRQMGLIRVGSHVDLDFDHQFIPAHKFDAKYSYKQDFDFNAKLNIIYWTSIRLMLFEQKQNQVL